MPNTFTITSEKEARFYDEPDKDIWFEKGVWTPTGNQAPSVTTQTGVWPKGLGYWRWVISKGSEEEANAERDAGGRRGTRVHDNGEFMLRGGRINLHDFIEKYFNGDYEAGLPEWRKNEAFWQWYVDLGQPRIVKRRNGTPAMECKLFSWEYQYGGRPDVILTGGELGHRKILTDYKTGKGIYLNFWAQLAAYFQAWHEMGECELDGAGIWRPNFRKNCGYDWELKTAEEMIDWFEDFKACQRIWHRENPDKNARPVYEMMEELWFEDPPADMEDHSDTPHESTAAKSTRQPSTSSSASPW